jgi:hypothetical protein
MRKPLKIKLTIPKPCSEDWAQMDLKERGRFCSHCSNIVTDFSTFTDKELLDYHSKEKGSGCGRFNNTQLNRLIIANEPANTPFYRRVLLGTALAAGVAGSAQGQNNSTTVNTNQASSPRASDYVQPAKDSICQINGTVVDSVTKEPVAYADIIIVKNGQQIDSVFSGLGGGFKFTVGREFLGAHLTILVHNEGYFDNTINCTVTKFPVQINPILLISTIKAYPALKIDSADIIMGIVAPLKTINTDKKSK